MSVIQDMIQKKIEKKEVQTIDIDDIYPNELNSAPIVNIDDLKKQIEEHNGLLKPIVVYQTNNNEYTLLDGERRLTACKELGYEFIDTIVVNRPENEVNEQLWILSANAQREDTAEYKKQRAEAYKNLFYQKKAAKEIEKNILMIDWVGAMMNLSGRQVQRLLKDETDEVPSPQEVVDSTLSQEVEDKETKKLIRKINKFADDLNGLEINCENEKLKYELELAIGYLKSVVSEF